MSPPDRSTASAWLSNLRSQLTQYVRARHREWYENTKALKPLQALASELMLETDEGLARAMADGGGSLLEDVRVKRGLAAISSAPNADCDDEILFVAGAASQFEEPDGCLTAEARVVLAEFFATKAVNWDDALQSIAAALNDEQRRTSARAFWAGRIAAGARLHGGNPVRLELLRETELLAVIRLSADIESRIAGG